MSRLEAFPSVTLAHLQMWTYGQRKQHFVLYGVSLAAFHLVVVGNYTEIGTDKYPFFF